MTVARQKSIALRSAYLVRQFITYYDDTLDRFVAWPGSPLPTVRFSTLPTGFDSGGAPSTIGGLGPFTMTASDSTAGVFYATVSSDLLLAGLETLVGGVIYQIVEGLPGSDSNGLTDVQPLLVIDPRYPLPG